MALLNGVGIAILEGWPDTSQDNLEEQRARDREPMVRGEDLYYSNHRHKGAGSDLKSCFLLALKEEGETVKDEFSLSGSKKIAAMLIQVGKWFGLSLGD